jgi:hypothetical protein
MVAPLGAILAERSHIRWTATTGTVPAVVDVGEY